MRGRGCVAVAAAVLVSLGTALPVSAAGPDPVIAVASVAEPTASAQSAPGNTLTAGSGLSAGDELRSTSGSYTFVLQSDGNAVVYGPKGVLWATGNRGTQLVMQKDGNLVLYPASGAATWSSRTDGASGARLALGDDGRLTVQSTAGATLWHTPADPGAAPAAGVDRLLPGAVLAAGQTLTAPGGAVLAMQRDGNLVRYEGGKATWATSTSGTDPQLVLQKDGNLVLYTADRGAVWSTRTDGRGGSLLVLQNDGNLVLYAGAAAVWATGVYAPAAETREGRVLALVNAERAVAGCQALKVDSRLAKAAALHSQDMRDRNYFSHTSPDGSTPTTRATAQGYPGGAGENIAAGYSTPESVMQAWMNSSGHRANILNCGYQSIGVGTATGGSYGTYWTQNFGRS